MCPFGICNVIYERKEIRTKVSLYADIGSLACELHRTLRLWLGWHAQKGRYGEIPNRRIEFHNTSIRLSVRSPYHPKHRR